MRSESAALEREASVGSSSKSGKKGSPSKSSAMSKVKPQEAKKNGKQPMASNAKSKGIAKPQSKASARTDRVATKEQRGAELWSQISTGRLVMKCTGSDEKRAWVQQGLEFFGV